MVGFIREKKQGRANKKMKEELIKLWEKDKHPNWKVPPKVGYLLEIEEDIEVGNNVVFGNVVRLGKRVALCSDINIGSCVIIKDDCTLGSSISIGEFVKMGNRCLICSGVKIGEKVKLFNNVRIDAWATIYDGVILRSNVQIEAGAVIKKTPLQIQGTRDFCYYAGKDIVAIGCRRFSIRHWRKYYRKIGEDSGYTESEIMEYKGYIDLFSTVIERERRADK